MLGSVPGSSSQVHQKGHTRSYTLTKFGAHSAQVVKQQKAMKEYESRGPIIAELSGLLHDSVEEEKKPVVAAPPTAVATEGPAGDYAPRSVKAEGAIGSDDMVAAVSKRVKQE